jgi:hypothetical protein
MVWGIRQRASIPAVTFVLELQALTTKHQFTTERMSLQQWGADQLDRSGKTLEPIADYSIWLVNGGCCYRFDLSGKPLEVLEELPSSDVGENKPSAHHSTGLRGIVPNGLINSDVCERQCYVAVYERGTYHFGCE